MSVRMRTTPARAAVSNLQHGLSAVCARTTPQLLGSTYAHIAVHGHFDSVWRWFRPACAFTSSCASAAYHAAVGPRPSTAHRNHHCQYVDSATRKHSDRELADSKLQFGQSYTKWAIHNSQRQSAQLEWNSVRSEHSRNNDLLLNSYGSCSNQSRYRFGFGKRHRGTAVGSHHRCDPAKQQL